MQVESLACRVRVLLVMSVGKVNLELDIDSGSAVGGSQLPCGWSYVDLSRITSHINYLSSKDEVVCCGS